MLWGFLLFRKLLVKFGGGAHGGNVAELSVNDRLGDVIPPGQTCEATQLSAVTSPLSDF